MDYKVVSIAISLVMMSSALGERSSLSWPECPCPKIMQPVCATNNLNFHSPCHFKCYADAFQRQTGIKLSILKESEC
uniref:Kazal-like domain-containing protein n=1 Tax=Papilio xuthus TaxID=66420 RepID=I4DLS7_PAPXU|nr:unknown secreted protein [Papilio xuthus]